MKGILHVGALLELQTHQDLVFPDGVYGVSVGAIVGTYIAFGLPLNTEILKEAFKVSNFIPEPDYSKLPQMISLKGVFDMDVFETSLVSMFLSQGVDLRTKVLGDAKMPLFIVASNLTKGKPSIFSKNVPVLDALKCSCCIPGVFRPQILYDQVYVDGDLFVPSVDKFIPNADKSICFSLKHHMADYDFRPSNIEDMSPIKYIHDMYTLVTQNFFNQVMKPCTLQLSYPNLRSMSNIDNFNLEDVLDQSGKKLRGFLVSKGCLHEVAEV